MIWKRFRIRKKKKTTQKYKHKTKYLQHLTIWGRIKRSIFITLFPCAYVHIKLFYFTMQLRRKKRSGSARRDGMESFHRGVQSVRF